MGKYSEGLTLSENSAIVVRAYEKADESCGLILEALENLYGDAEGETYYSECVQKTYEEYVDCIFKILGHSVRENFGNKGNTKV